MPSISKNKRKMVYEKFSGKCCYCGDALNLEDFNVDHIIPKSHRGKGNIDNLMPSCSFCNFTKGALSVEQYRKKISNLPEYNTAVKLYLKHFRVKIHFVKFYFEK
jgi:5-methylcytosine-specific restriction endonuclease McrA